MLYASKEKRNSMFRKIAATVAAAVVVASALAGCTPGTPSQAEINRAIGDGIRHESQGLSDLKPEPYSVDVLLSAPATEGTKGSATVYITVPSAVYNQFAAADETLAPYREVTHGYALLSPLQRRAVNCLYEGSLMRLSLDEGQELHWFDVAYVVAPSVTSDVTSARLPEEAYVINPDSCSISWAKKDKDRINLELTVESVVVTVLPRL
jgi:hypothetical protein